MAMFYIVLALLTITVTAQEKRQLCPYICTLPSDPDLFGLGSCPHGSVCKAGNICGTFCEPVTAAEKRQLCQFECGITLAQHLSGMGPCPIGYVCKNHFLCGTYCESETSIVGKKREYCPITTYCNDPYYKWTATPSCPDGFVCRSDICGEKCHPITPVDKRQLCSITCGYVPIHKWLGLSPCPAGYACKSNGCGRSCHPVLTATAP